MVKEVPQYAVQFANRFGTSLHVMITKFKRCEKSRKILHGSLLALAVSLISSSSKAQNVQTADFNFTLNSTDKTAIVTKYKGASADVTVPATVEFNGTQYNVTKIGASSFAYSSGQKVTLGENITTIDNNGFKYANNLTHISLNNKLETIGAEAFGNCAKLEYIGMESLENITNPKNLQMPASLKTIGNLAFYGTMISGKMYLGALLDSVGVNPWRALQGITYIEVADENNKFCSKDGVLFNKGVTEIYSYPAGKEDETYTLPSTVVKINDQSMRNNSFMKQIILPEGLKTIGTLAFLQSGLTSITLPASLTDAYSGFISMSYDLAKINLASGNTTYTLIGDMLVKKDDCKLIAAPAYKGEVAIPEGVKIVGYQSFYYCKATKVTFPSSLRVIEQSAFYQSEELKNIDLGSGVEQIDKMAFQNCKALETVIFPKQLKTLGNQVFCNCTSIKKVELNEGLEYIGDNMFYMCTGIVEGNIPSTVKYCGYGLYYMCSALSKVTLPEGITRIPKMAFYSDTKIQKITIPSTVKVLEDYCLYSIPISKITLPEGLDSIGRSAVYKTRIDELVIPNSVKTIAAYAFSWSEYLTKVEFGTGIKSIGDYAFQNCNKVKSFELNEGLDSLGNFALAFNQEVEKIVLPSTLTKIGYMPMNLCPKLTSIYNNATKPQILPAEPVDEDTYKICTLYVPENTASLYGEAEYWKDFKIQEFTGVDVINSDNDATVVSIHTLDGMKVVEPQKGVNIYKMSDGTTRKVMK